MVGMEGGVWEGLGKGLEMWAAGQNSEEGKA